MVARRSRRWCSSALMLTLVALSACDAELVSRQRDRSASTELGAVDPARADGGTQPSSEAGLPSSDKKVAGSDKKGVLPDKGAPPTDPSALHVSGNKIVNGAGQTVTLRGVNRSGTEYACAQGWGIFDGPSDAASVQAIKSWKANAVRVPLNESCWLAINGVAPAYSGSTYQTAIANYVDLLHQNGLTPVVELHWSAAGSEKALKQAPMPNQDHTPEFWKQVAASYKNKEWVVFELYNEPYPDGNSDTAEAWRCWRDGGTCAQIPYQVAGMQTLITAVRSTGAKNVILAGGVQYSNSISGWLTHKPSDPTGNLGAAWHVYNFNLCINSNCYNNQIAPVLQQVPVVATEIGEDDCGSGFINPLMSFLDSHGGGYLAWVWDTWGGCLVLINDYGGSPAGAYGQAYKSHLVAVQP